ncbi:MAG: hypothetical protein ABI673_11125 [Novosphingobium sp.]
MENAPGKPATGEKGMQGDQSHVNVVATTSQDSSTEAASRKLFADYVQGFNSQNVDDLTVRFYARDINFERKSRRFTMKMFAFYTVENGMFRYIKVSRQEPGQA